MQKRDDEMRRTSAAWMEAVPVDETRDADGKDRVLRVRGYAILWNSPSERMGRIVETIDPRSLDHLGDLNRGDVRMQGQHEGNALARTTNGTLRLSKDARGVLIEADLDARRSESRDLYYAIERGDVSQMSFGFRIAAGGETLEDQPDGTIRAHVTRIESLLEVSAVTFPAYRATSIEALPESCVDCGADPCECEHDTDEHADGERAEPIVLRTPSLSRERFER
jgi:HK97 family phage prohead protease